MYQYLISLRDRFTTPATQMAGRWNALLARMDQATTRATSGMNRAWQRVSGMVNRAGGSINSLQTRIDRLRAYRGGLDIHLDRTALARTNSEIDRLERRLNRAQGGGRGGGGMGGLLLAGGLYGAAAFAGAKAVESTIKPAMALEANQFQMGVMLKDQGAAANLVGQGRQFAKDTLFDTPEVVESQRMLLSFGETSGRVMPILKMLGDVSAGTGNSLKDMIPILGKIKATGHLQGDEMNQFAERGLNLRPYIAKAMNVKESQLAKLQEAGKISYAHIIKAFGLMTSGDGIYADMSAKMAESTTQGRFQKTMGEFQERLTDLGMRALPFVNKALEYAGVLMDRIAPLGAPIEQAFMAFAPLGRTFVKMGQSLGVLDAQGQVSITFLDKLGAAMEKFSKVLAHLTGFVEWCFDGLFSIKNKYTYEKSPLGFAKNLFKNREGVDTAAYVANAAVKAAGAQAYGGGNAKKITDNKQLAANKTYLSQFAAKNDPTGLGGGTGVGSLASAAGVDASVSGAQRKTTIVNVKSLVEHFEVHVQTINEGVANLQEQVVDALTRAIASAS